MSYPPIYEMKAYKLLVDVPTQITPITAVVIAPNEFRMVSLFRDHGGYTDFAITKVMSGARVFSQYYCVISPEAYYIAIKAEYDYMEQQEE